MDLAFQKARDSRNSLDRNNGTQAFLQVLEAIRSQEPPRPSARLSSSTHEAVSGISAKRQIEPSKLKGILRGELDWIVMKAIEKDRTRRYETASNFAEDVERYLSGETVLARPPSAGYRFSKYVRRHKGLVASLLTIAAMLFAAMSITIYLYVEAERARAAISLEKSKVEQQRAVAEEQRIIAVEAQADTQLALQRSEAVLSRSVYLSAIQRWEENRVGDAKRLLLEAKPEYRNFEWHYARREFEGSDVTLYGHSNPVVCVAFSLDGSHISSTTAGSAPTKRFLNNINIPYGDGIDLRRARLRFDGTMYNYIDYAIEFDFVNSFRACNQPINISTPGFIENTTTAPTDFWWQVKDVPWFGTVRKGIQKEPIGFEHQVSSRFLPFMERSYNQLDDGRCKVST